MLSILDAEGNYIATRVTGKITKADYQKIIPIINEQLQTNNKIRWYFEMENFEGWDMKGLYEEVNFDIKHAKDLEKIAMVGEKKWTEWLSDLMKPFTSAEVKHFDPAQKEEAKAWIKIQTKNPF